MPERVGYEDGNDAPPDQANRRNGTASKRLKGQDGELPIAVPRDRDGSFEPELVKKGQTCIVHLVRHSLNFCAWKDRKAVAADLRLIYGAATADLAAAELDAFDEK